MYLAAEQWIQYEPDPAFIKDDQGRYRQVNSAYARAFDIELDEIIGKTDQDLLPVELAQSREAREKRVRDEKISLSGREEIVSHGRTLVFKTMCIPLLDDQGRITGVMGVSRRVLDTATAPGEAEGEAVSGHEPTEYLGNILEYTTDMIITTDLNRRIRSFNRGGELMLGYTREEILGMDVEALYVESEERWALFRHVVDMGSVSNYETQLIHRDGHVVDISLTLSQLKDSQGRMIGTVGISKDISDRKAVEEKLRLQRIELQETRDYLNSILENTGDMIITTDLNRRIVSFNRGGELMLGYTREEILGRDVEDLYVEPEERWALMRHVMDMDTVSNYETQLIHKDGHRVDISLTLSQLKDDQGRMIGTVGISKNISDQKAVEEKLRLQRIELKETRDYLNSILENTGDMIITTDLNRRIVSFNRGGELMLGYTREEILGRDVEELYVEPEERWALMRHVMDMGSVSNYETQLVHKNGRILDISLTLSQLRDDQGRMIGTVGISKDISDQKAVEEKLRRQRIELQETRDYLNSILENTGDMIITTDLDRRIVSFNQGGELMLGYSRAEILGRSIEMLYPTEEERRNLLKRVMEEGSVANYETQLIHKDGHLIDVNLTLSQLKNDEGEIIGTVGISKDVTEQKILQKKLVQSERLAAVGQTAAGLAHYIKNVVNGLKGASYMLNTGLKRDRKELIEEGWDTVEMNIQRVSALAMDMLHLSKDREPEYESIDINALVIEVCRLIEETAADRDVHLELDLNSDIGPVSVDSKGMHRSLLNLLTNAIEAFDDLEEDRVKRIEVRTDVDGPDFIIQVQDNATGISPDNKARLFSQFFSTKAGMGTGLGLAVTQKIIAEHGGRIEVNSVWGQGATFTICLPRPIQRDA